jgi:hypothetical protein
MSLFIYFVVLAVWSAVALLYVKRAVKSVGVYRFSRAVVTACDPQVCMWCGDPECPASREVDQVADDIEAAAVLTLAIEDTHREVRTEAIVAVIGALVALAVAVYAFGLLMGRLV